LDLPKHVLARLPLLALFVVDVLLRYDPLPFVKAKVLIILLIVEVAIGRMQVWIVLLVVIVVRFEILVQVFEVALLLIIIDV